MTTFQIDDQACFHAKVVRAGNEAFGAWCRAGSWCMAHLTDGHVTRDIAVTIAASHVWHRLRDCGLPGPGLVEEVEDGYQIHDWSHWQRTSAEILKHRLDQAKRQKNRRVALRSESKGQPKVTPVVTEVVTPSVTRDVPREYCSPNPDPLTKGETEVSPPTLEKKTPQTSIPGVKRTTASALTPKAWGEWRRLYSEAYGVTYIDDPGDNRVLAALIASAKQASESRQEPDAVIVVLTHWFRAYLRDQAPYLSQHKHPLRCAAKDLNSYGTPWTSQRPAIPQHRPIVVPEPMTPADAANAAEARARAIEALRGL